eukprot:5103902-Amphidinium_carterae.1
MQRGPWYQGKLLAIGVSGFMCNHMEAQITLLRPSPALVEKVVWLAPKVGPVRCCRCREQTHDSRHGDMGA